MDNHKIIIVNGTGRVGKDTFVNDCLNTIYFSQEKTIKEELIKISNIDSVFIVKKIAKELGWDGNKTETNRKFLSDLKDLLTNWQNIPYQSTINKITETKQRIRELDLPYSLIFVHSREPKEIQRYVSHYSKDNCLTLLVKNPNIPIIQSNHADKDIENYHYDFIVNNNGSLEDLYEKAKLFCYHVLVSNINKYYYD